MMAAQLQQASGAAANLVPMPGEDGRPPTLQAEAPDMPPSAPLVNRAGESTSPYVQAHAYTPIAWQLLDEDAIGRAKRENKPIFMNIGYRACHYCRLTTHDSFCNAAVANLLNKWFIPIIVDREERPDIDFIYMNYILAVNSAGGWPLNVFLTPELKPIFGGTYWPGPGSDLPEEDGQEDAADVTDIHDNAGLDFLAILRKLKKVWQEQEGDCRQEADKILSQLRDFAAEGTLGTPKTATPLPRGASSAATPVDCAATVTATAAARTSLELREEDIELDLDQLEEAYMHLARSFDPIHGGFGTSPKFPTPARLSFLLRLTRFPEAVQDVIGDEEVSHATHMALHTLRRIRDSGLRDHVGGGFARYSVMEDWSMPHFEKMITDNALLLSAYLDAWLSTAGGKLSIKDEFADIVVELADYLTSPPMCLEGGGFASSEAADSYLRRGDRHMHEGAYYLWTRREFDTAVGSGGEVDSQASNVTAAYWNILQHGNIPRDFDPNDEFLNQNVLYVRKDAVELSRHFGIPADEVMRLVASARQKLRAYRARERVRPETDQKIVVSYNGMAIASLARTGAAIKLSHADDEKADQYLGAAVEAASFIREKMWDPQAKILYRTYHGSRSNVQGFAEDYAFLTDGLLELYEATGSDAWLEWADELQETQYCLFYDPTTDSDESTATQTVTVGNNDEDVPATPAATGSTTINSATSRSHSGAFYATAEDSPHTILRLKDGMDTAQPSTNAISASNLFRLGALLGDAGLTARARETVNAFEVEMLQYPWLFVGLLAGVVTARLGGEQRVVVCGGGPGVETKDKEAVLRRYFTTPRAGLRTIVYLHPGDEDSWLSRRRRRAAVAAPSSPDVPSS